MRIRLFNGKVLALANGFEVVCGEVWVEGERIVYCGSSEGVREVPEFDREIDLRGNLVLPGFKNAHTHSAMTFLRSFADDLPLSEWLNQQVFPMEAKLTEEDIYTLSCS